MRVSLILLYITFILMSCNKSNTDKIIQNKSSELKKNYNIYPSRIEINETNENSDLFSYVNSYKKIVEFDTSISLPINGSYNGYSKKFKLAFIGGFIENKPHGIFHFFNEQVKLFYSVLYNKGLKEGPIVFYNAEGCIVASGFFKNNYLDGDWFEWHDCRVLKFHTKVIDKTVNDTYKYDKTGLLIQETKILSRNENSVSWAETTYFSNGNVKEYSKKIISEGIGPIRIDRYIEYFSNGNIKAEGSYTKYIGQKELKIINDYYSGVENYSLKSGRWIYYDSLNNKTSEEYYSEGYKLVKRIIYTKQGYIKSITNYDGIVPYSCSRSQGYEVKEGVYIEYYPENKIKIRGFYSNNRRNGKWTYLKPDGNIERVEVFRNDSIQ